MRKHLNCGLLQSSGLASILPGLSAFAAGVLALQLTTAAHAQQAANNNDQAGGLETILVTANRRVENVQKVPVSATSLDSEQLTNAGISGTMDLMNVVPGLNITVTGNTYSPYIRGVGTTAVGLSIQPSVETYVDGVLQYGAAGGLQQLNNIQRAGQSNEF